MIVPGFYELEIRRAKMTDLEWNLISNAMYLVIYKKLREFPAKYEWGHGIEYPLELSL